MSLLLLLLLPLIVVVIVVVKKVVVVVVVVVVTGILVTFFSICSIFALMDFLLRFDVNSNCRSGESRIILVAGCLIGYFLAPMCASSTLYIR